MITIAVTVTVTVNVTTTITIAFLRVLFLFDKSRPCLLQVCGYVQHVAKAGMFVTLSRDLVARVKLGELAASFVEDPEAAFPPGTLVKGRVLSVQGDR